MSHTVLAVCAGLVAIVASFAPLRAETRPTPSSGSLSPEMWGAYKARFVRNEGRVVDDANGGISHSELQGYGLLLAYLAGDRIAFETIWSFTRIELLIRDDGLAAWRWDPNATPRVTDINNATDGDILIAYALGLAGASWRVPGYLTAGRAIAKAVGAKAVDRYNEQVLLMPAVTGFSRNDRADGPVVNPSYWVFEALPVLAGLAPETDWAAVGKQGLALLDALAAADKVAPDWVSMRAKPVPAQGFEPVFGYNAVRVPLYLMRAGLADTRRLAAVREAWKNGPGIVSFATGAVTMPWPEQGYRLIAAAMACILDKTPIPNDLRRFEPTLYYPSTLYLLSAAMLEERYKPCL